MAKRTKKRLSRLWQDDKRCHWCGVETVLCVPGPNKPHAATVDHIFSRLNPERPDDGGPKVLACWKCNRDRGRMECTEEFAAEHRRRSRGPGWRDE